jgi:acyl-CoA thioester hydrolase
MLYAVDLAVRWSDLDADGRVNNVLVLRFAEEARMRWAASLGLDKSHPALMPVVASLGCSFKAPIGYPATLRVEVGCTRLGRSSMDLAFSLVDADTRAACATATAAWVWVDKASGKPVAIPGPLRALCEAALSNNGDEET